jgi:hypothetical protein
LVEDRHRFVERTFRDPGDAIEGDHIQVYCRKPIKSYDKIRAAEGHHYFRADAKMNALAVLMRTFKNLQKS